MDIEAKNSETLEEVYFNSRTEGFGEGSKKENYAWNLCFKRRLL